MVIEYVRYGLADAAQADAFERDYALAAHFLDESAQCLSYELARCEEHPLQYVLRICWESADAHLEGFRKSAAFEPFVRLVRPYMAQLLEMRHYRPTAIRGDRACADNPGPLSSSEKGGHGDS